MPKRKTTEEYKNELQLINNDLELLSEYTGNHNKVKVKCLVCEYVFEGDASNFLKGHGCPKCANVRRSKNQARSHNDFVEKLKDIQPTLEVLSTYKNSVTKITVLCKTCGNKYDSLPSNLLKGYGCKQCYLNGIKRTREEFCMEVEKINPNMVIGDDYIDGKHKVTTTCKICGYSRKVVGNNFLNKKCECPKCNGNIKLTDEEFKENVRKLNPNITVKTSYNGADKRVSCECKVCGYNWSSIANALIRYNATCPACERKKASIKRRKTHEEFVLQAKNEGSTIEFLSTYKRMADKISCRCKNCGYEWEANPNTLIHGKFRCPSCQTISSKIENKIQEYLNAHNVQYFMYMSYDDLFGVNGGKLSYDFYLPKYNLLIEGQGKQHLEPIKHFGGERTFQIQQEHDRRKREYAKQNNINLLEIWFWDLDNIKEILDENLTIDSKEKSA